MKNFVGNIEALQKEDPWWVESEVWPHDLVNLVHREARIRYVNQCEDVDWLKTVQAKTADKPVLTAIKRRLYRLEVAWGYDVVIRLRSPFAQKEAHKQGDEKSVRRWAMLQSHACGIISMTPLSREAWLRAYGNGKTRM